MCVKINIPYKDDNYKKKGSSVTAYIPAKDVIRQITNIEMSKEK